MVRITSGEFCGRLLKTPKDVRPTQDRVRKALFDVLGMDVPGRRVLDLFAGSGALGVEALSREAASALFVDEDAGSVRAIRDNLAALGLGEEKAEGILRLRGARAPLRSGQGRQKAEVKSRVQGPGSRVYDPGIATLDSGLRTGGTGGRVAEVWRSDYREALRRLRLAERTFDLVLLDPPYREGLLPEALEALAGAGTVADGGLVVAESEARLPTPAAGGLTPLDERTYGGTKLMFWVRRET